MLFSSRHSTRLQWRDSGASLVPEERHSESLKVDAIYGSYCTASVIHRTSWQVLASSWSTDRDLITYEVLIT